MIQLTKLNESLRDLIALSDKEALSRFVDLDSIDLVLRECLSIEEMREAGSFFTGQELATKTIQSLQSPITSNSVVIDPTCGAGNLLIECSRQLEVSETLSDTFQRWGKVLWGFDLYQSFIEATKLRLIVEAILRGAVSDCSIEEAMRLLPNIRVQDALTVPPKALKRVTHAVMNPPFTIWSSPKENYWKVGKVNAAGIVFDKYIRLLPDGCFFSAILPDVLRSGSRYECFRKFVSSSCVGQCDVWGRFNSKTDVDVFLLSGKLYSNLNTDIEWFKKVEAKITLGDEYNVRIGPLVAYRDPEQGEEYPYFHPKNSPAWEVVTQSSEMRRFEGTVIKPPFVLIKRTSSPTDRFRATATIVNIKEAVAVENHMIVIQPKSNTIRDCRKLMRVLRSKRTNDFLNHRIRLRHLTVGVVKEIPL